ncbi:MAG: hypothetical protein WB689_05850 [Xanthobacteraceae bacterium]
MSGKFFLLFGIFSLKTENHLLGKKISQNSASRVLNLLFPRLCGKYPEKSWLYLLRPVLRASPAEPLKVRFSPIRDKHPDAASSRYLPMGDIPAMSALPPKADITYRDSDVR